MLQRLKQVRKALGYTQTEFAKFLGITQTSYSMIENGIRPLSDKYVRIICITFNVSEQYLVSGQGELLPDTQDYLLIMAKELLKMQQKLFECTSPLEDNTDGKKS